MALAMTTKTEGSRFMMAMIAGAAPALAAWTVGARRKNADPLGQGTGERTMPQREPRFLRKIGLPGRVSRRRARFSIDPPRILRYRSALIALGCGDAHLTVTSC
jgi:hypothetical protein